MLAAAVADRGFAMLPDQLVTPRMAAEIRDFLEPQPCFDSNRPAERFTLARKPPECRYAVFDLQALLRCPYLLEISNHPLVLGAVERVLGCKPTITTMQAWWSFVGAQGSPDDYKDEVFHRDVADFAFIKLFVYLSDVDLGAGPHVFVRGSHRSPKMVRRAPLTNEEVGRSFPPDDVVTFLGAPGTSFLENTWGIHRASPLQTRNRLVFSVNYTITSMNLQAPAEPVKLDLRSRGSFDPYVNRVCLRNGTNP